MIHASDDSIRNDHALVKGPPNRRLKVVGAQGMQKGEELVCQRIGLPLIQSLDKRLEHRLITEESRMRADQIAQAFHWPRLALASFSFLKRDQARPNNILTRSDLAAA